jgi:hypothetical protein
MDMFNQKSIHERIGSVKKSETLNHLKEVEKYFLQAIVKYKIEPSYDVIANELPFFKTMNYTEWAHCFISHPLNQELRLKQMTDAYNDNAEVAVDWVNYFAKRVTDGQSNKYAHINKVVDERLPARENLVVLVGSNKLKERICLTKLRWIKDKFEDDVFFKPHPLTTYALIGELKDLFGNERILDRDTDMYWYLTRAKTIWTSHMSESAVYAASLGKTLEPIDVYQKVEQGSFYHINKFLFTVEDPKEWINRVMNSPKCGIFNPLVDINWKAKIDAYLEYIAGERAKFKNKYIAS